MKDTTTIAAIATPLGNGAISIVRMSGDNALSIAAKLFRTSSLKDFNDAAPKQAYYGTFKNGKISDKCVAVYFKAPNSYTGEDMVEFQCHGGVRLTSEVLRSLVDFGARPATKGEYTKRAFLNGKMTLADAEGVVDMINAESIAGLEASYRLMNGDIARTIDSIQDEIIDLISGLEASLDYPEELEEDVKRNGVDVIKNVHIELKNLLTSAKFGRYIKNGINVAIIGIPNIGKSSLLNALLKRDRAIVTDIAGTTRDTLEEKYEVEGIILNLIDTAGIRKRTDDIIEEIGVKKAVKVAKQADLVILLLDSTRAMNEEEKHLIETYSDKRLLKVYNKCDQGIHPSISKDDNIFISALTGEGIDALTKHIVDIFLDNHLDNTGNIITSERHVDAISRALDSIKSCNYSIEDAPIECTLVDLRNAYSALGEITGKTASEDIIDRVFARFCVGK